MKAPQTRYLHKDNLGSVDTITDAVGNIVDRMSFDPFGGRRQNNWREATAGVNLIPVLTNRGFTGHEHLDDVGLIHMNGRVYDAELGRFLSADPNVQAPYATQNLNRYAMNNPLKYTDPSGFFFKKLFRSIKKFVSNAVKFVKKYWRVIVAAVVTYYTFGAVQGWALANVGTSCSLVTANVIGGAAAGFAGGLVASGGDLKAATIGALTGAAGGLIGASSAFGSVGDVTAGRVLAHGVVGGISSKAQGGKFSSGFLSSAFTKSVSGRIQTIAGENQVGGVLASAAVGGTASVIGGGKFANGAVTSSLQYVVNQIATNPGKNYLKKMQQTFSALKLSVTIPAQVIEDFGGDSGGSDLSFTVGIASDSSSGFGGDMGIVFSREASAGIGSGFGAYVEYETGTGTLQDYAGSGSYIEAGLGIVRVQGSLSDSGQSYQSISWGGGYSLSGGRTTATVFSVRSLFNGGIYDSGCNKAIC
ncbi:RHS repeat-associated core domain-containing protein [uncultured Amphritea sp.]|uniref:RHS repeat domain-containing protein n=1 Tax=uncultured Amphritea sp. TaxID=981605 RepID=UPI00260660A7|nr:RHS repeat-associated core domain-containing protein [uncultured Amphritea sp.]